MSVPHQPPRSAGGRGRRWLGNLVVAGMAFLLSLAFAEGVLRVFGQRPIYEMYSKPSLLWQHDPLLGWSLEPNASETYVGPRPWPIEFSAHVSINSLGLRGPEIPAPDPEELRVLFLGDSAVAGFEVEYEQTFAALLAERLSDRLGRPVRTINAGVRGYGTDQSYLYYTDGGRLLQPDLVVLFHSSNDPADNMTIHEMRRPFGKPAVRPSAEGALQLVAAPVPRYPACSEWVLDNAFEPRRIDTFVGRSICHVQMGLLDHSSLFSLLTIMIPWDAEILRKLYYLGNPHPEQLAAHGRKQTRDAPSRILLYEVLQALANAVEDDGGDFLLIGEGAHLSTIDPSHLENLNIPVYPITGAIDAPQLEIRWRHDSHYNPTGHRRVADELAPVLASRLGDHLARGTDPGGSGITTMPLTPAPAHGD